MIIYSFSPDVGKPISAYDSQNLMMSRILNGAAEEIHMGCMHLGAGGTVGLHRASIPQLLLIVQGEGVVIGQEKQEVPIRSGMAAYWEEGEWHETRTENGLTAIVIESPALIVRMPETQTSN
ncbi:cupin [Cohnella lubricantis]|uniref:Cupin n=1 Tax=Cohnella lubricantis TaxID=2163172 RepID=A0A841TFU6_9BACL|nr:cupin [Cohnella lubricantis]MBB6677817.1 cupin [Cohnella lubricantis]MBP2120508.1 mannose-6-phosphate isomerase-like protein (cupin superfamily) [Cohnella lubricantis]